MAALVAGRLVRLRRDAEEDAETITALYDRLDGLFAEQRSISETLQHALLPQTNPSIPYLEVATRYVAGADGVDIGGDWYSIIGIDDSHFGFVVGDISGRGVEAAAIMARVRFTLRAYLVEGHPPEVALQMCSRQLDLNQDGHFATVIIGVGNVNSRQLTLASAGHLNPLIVSGEQAEFVPTAVGPPFGVVATSYQSTTVTLPPDAVLLAFTDGLVERRNEDLDIGLQRLADSAATTTDRTLDDLLTDLLSVMTGDRADDDIAILAFKWTTAQESKPVVALAAGPAAEFLDAGDQEQDRPVASTMDSQPRLWIARTVMKPTRCPRAQNQVSRTRVVKGDGKGAPKCIGHDTAVTMRSVG